MADLADAHLGAGCCKRHNCGGYDAGETEERVNDDIQGRAGEAEQPPAYQAPTVTCLGSLAALTQKTVGAFDGTTFLGEQIAS